MQRRLDRLWLTQRQGCSNRSPSSGSRGPPPRLCAKVGGGGSRLGPCRSLRRAQKDPDRRPQNGQAGGYANQVSSGTGSFVAAKAENTEQRRGQAVFEYPTERRVETLHRVPGMAGVQVTCPVDHQHRAVDQQNRRQDPSKHEHNKPIERWASFTRSRLRERGEANEGI